MKFSELYEKSISRKMNPAVSVSDFKDETVNTEIDEYVFTEAIIINLFNVLSNIKRNQGSHVGIWINGYYGSGKSHFLKYASYCLSFSREHRERAFSRLIEATRTFQSRRNSGLTELDNEGISIQDFEELRKWYLDNAEVEMVLFNIGDVHNANDDQATVFTSIFWNQFNKLRGYNSSNLALAQHLEKPLDEDGKFEEFKQYISNEGYNWEKHLSILSAAKLDNITLKIAKDVDPTLSYDVIRRCVAENDINISVEEFAKELNLYIKEKKNDNPHYRLLFFVDEVSEFIGKHSDLLLQLQSIVKRFDEECKSRVWVACTAQQTLEDVVENVGSDIKNPEDKVGKILGRFEVRASLQGTSAEYITQNRILEKSGNSEMALENRFEVDRNQLEAQFVLPSNYRAFTNREDFANYYPFIPYQFKLIMDVLNSFVKLGFVDRQVKGNERSLINIVYSIAQETADKEMGELIPFDRFFCTPLRNSIQHTGQLAMKNGENAIALIENDEERAFSFRVFYALFMLCHLSDNDKQTFPANIDFITTLLLDKIDAHRPTIRESVLKVLNYLMDKSVIRIITKPNGDVIYDFYTEEESKMAQLIKNADVLSDTYTEELTKIITSYISISEKVDFGTRSFSIGANVDRKHIRSAKPDVEVDFKTTALTESPDLFAQSNQYNHIVFFIYPVLNENKDLRKKFNSYCQVQSYFQRNAPSSDEQIRVRRLFQERAKEEYDREIFPAFRTILDTCPVIAGQSVLGPAELGNAKKDERYKKALEWHLAELYKYAQLVSSTSKTDKELADAIRRPTVAALENTPLTEAEKRVKDFLERQNHDVTVNDVVVSFAGVPYGWSDNTTIYTLNELVRRHLYAFNYNNNPNVSREEVANHIVKEKNRFTIEKAQAIPKELIDSFVDSWKDIFNNVSFSTRDSTELYRVCNEKEDSYLNNSRKEYDKLYRSISSYPFAPVIGKVIDQIDQWQNIRDHKLFFEAVINAKDAASVLFDNCKNIRVFHDTDIQFKGYKELLSFIEANKDNFSFLQDECQQKVDSICQAVHDPEPWKNLRSYMKLKGELGPKLQERKSELVEQVKQEYNKVYEILDQYAEKNHVSQDKYERQESVIATKTHSSNFFVLKDNANTTSFLQEQMDRIDAAIPHENNIAAESSTRTYCKVIRPQIETRKPLSSEADVDNYLRGIKAQLMPFIKEGKEIIIK